MKDIEIPSTGGKPSDNDQPVDQPDAEASIRQTTGIIRALGPGLVTGASDDDPSGIATYSQAGAQFGYALGWTMVLTYPLMGAVQEISARIGRVTGTGLAGNIRQHYPRWLLRIVVGLILIANTINIGADLGAMAAAVQLLVGGPSLVYVVMFGLVCVILEVFVRYKRYSSLLKWLACSLLAYVAAFFAVSVPWREVIHGLVVPKIEWSADYLLMIVALLGTTISPYLFFWQAGQEVEDQREKPGAKPLNSDPTQGRTEIQRIAIDTYIGMALSNIIALFIILTTAATLHANGITNIETSAKAAEALRPIAGEFAFALFATGIIGTGFLAIPILAGSAAYALGEAVRRPVGLARKWNRAKTFYGTIAVATLVGVGLNFSSIDPVKALFWSAVINGISASPIMVIMMLLATRPIVMGHFVIPPRLRIIGWLATLLMAGAGIATVVSWIL